MNSVVFQHGWAFDSSFWQDYQTIEGAVFNDRGYWEGECYHNFKDGKKILVTHSYGLHLAKNLIEEADLLIVLGGFLSFPNKIAVKLMLNKADSAVLEKFYRRSGYNTDKAIFTDRLHDDLKSMLTSDLTPTLSHFKGEVFIYHNRYDKIVDVDEAYRLNYICQNSHLIIEESSNHINYSSFKLNSLL